MQASICALTGRRVTAVFQELSNAADIFVTAIFELI